MGKFDCSVTIDRPIEEVFAVLSDPTRSPEWSKHSIRGDGGDPSTRSSSS